MSNAHYIEPSEVSRGDRLAVQWTDTGGWITVSATDQGSIDALDDAHRIVLLENVTAPWPSEPCIFVNEALTGAGFSVTGYGVRQSDGSYQVGDRILFPGDRRTRIDSWDPVGRCMPVILTRQDLEALPAGTCLIDSANDAFRILHSEGHDYYDVVGITTYDADEHTFAWVTLPARVLPTDDTEALA